MSEKVDVKQALRIYQFITDRGAQCPGGYRLDGITASTSHDGYTVILEDARVRLLIGFHNTYHVEYGQRVDLDAFLEHLDKLDRLSRADDDESD